MNRKVFEQALKIFFALTLVAGVLAPASPTAALPQQPAPLAAQTPGNVDQIIIKYKSEYIPDEPMLMDDLNAAAGVTFTYVDDRPGNAYILGLPSLMTLDAAWTICESLMTYLVDDSTGGTRKLVSAMPWVKPNDPGFAPPGIDDQGTIEENDLVNQWHFHGDWGINAPAAWSITTGREDTVVAVLDTGVVNHVDDSTHLIYSSGGGDGYGYDFVSRDNNPTDTGNYLGCPTPTIAWQGTHVAGIIGAASDNTIPTGVAGINWNAKILPVRVVNGCNAPTAADIIDGMRWAAGMTVSGVPANSKPADVIHVSANVPISVSDPLQPCGNYLPGTTTTYQSYIDAINNSGAVIVAANGDNTSFPAICKNVLNVGVVDASGQQAFGSGFKPDLSAPGGGNNQGSILSTSNGGTEETGDDIYKGMEGTVMAAAHVSGTVSLMFGVNPRINAGQVFAILKKTVKAFPSGTCTTDNCGWGILDAGEAVRIADKPDLIITGATLPNETPFLGQQFQVSVTVQNQGGEGLRDLNYGASSPTNRQVYVGRDPSAIERNQYGCVGETIEGVWEDDWGEFYRNELNSPVGSGLSVTMDVDINNQDPLSSQYYNQWTKNNPVPWKSGTHNLYVYVDANCAVNESFEDNNSLAIPLVINRFIPGALLYPRNGQDIGIDYNPNYQWNIVTGVASYRLYVTGPSGKIVDQSFNASLICDENTNVCSVSPGLTPTLGGGSYSWKVLPLGGSWPAPATFTTLGKPGKVTSFLEPVGDITNYSPTFRWGEVAGVTSYLLQVASPKGTKLLNKWYPASTYCSGGTCVVPKPLNLGVGRHQWAVRTWNPAGYGDWSAAATFTASGKPGKVTSFLSPVENNIKDYSPTFRWGEVEGATSYLLYVSSLNGTKLLQKWYPASTYCSGGTCEVVKPLSLGTGSHQWAVRTWNPAGYGDWSAAKDFSTASSTPATVTENMSPEGDISTDYSPTFTWKKADGATSYLLRVVGPTGTKLLEKWYPASTYCSGENCVVTKPLSLGSGSHTWWVRSWNPAGYGDWSAAVFFATTLNTPGKVTSFLSPVGDNITDYSPTFRWEEVAGATSYLLQVSSPKGTKLLNKWYLASTNCGGGTCTVVKPLSLGTGRHQWAVRTWNLAGYGDWSAAATFTMASSKPATVNLGAAGTVPGNGGNLDMNYNPTFTWKKADGATSYLLRVDGPTGTILLNKWFPSATYCAVGDTCSVPFSAHRLTLKGGSHKWRVRSWGPAGYGDWSVVNIFTTIPQTVPAASTPLINGLPNISPKTQPVYVWSRVPMAVSYRLYVKGPSGKVLEIWKTAVEVCGGDYCSIPNPGTLGNGDHTWWVQTWNPAGYGPWRSATFKVQSALPAAANLLLKAGEPVYKPVYTWDEVDTATRYHLFVNGPDYALDEWHDSWNICDAGKCSVTNPTTLTENGVYTWSVMAYNSTAGYGLWANANFNPLKAPTNLSPNSEITEPVPTYTWDKVDAATQYDLFVTGPGNYTLDIPVNSSSCGAQCSVESPDTLANGDYTWSVTPSNAGGDGDAATETFKVNVP